jgi:hypothetical protein
LPRPARFSCSQLNLHAQIARREATTQSSL